MAVAKGYKQTPEHIDRKAKAKKRGKYFSCKLCGIRFWRKPFEISKGNNKFCSRKCYQLNQIGKPKPIKNRRSYNGKDNPNWKGGISLPRKHSNSRKEH